MNWKGWEEIAVSLPDKYVLLDNRSCKPPQQRYADRQEVKYVEKD